MKARSLMVAILLVVSISRLFAGSAAAEGAGSNRGTYLSRAGYIIHPDEIHIEHYIAQRDYDYPLPDSGDLNVITGTGINAENAYILLGLKGHQVPFSELPPLNISFCIDRSGSMTGVMPWVKDCFYIFINRVRDGDIVSLVDMNNEAQTLIPPTAIRSEADRTEFKRQVDRIEATGSTNVYAGMQQSYEEIERNFDPSYVNRVVILTDGMHNFGQMTNQNMLELAAQYNKRGTNISTVLLGIEAATGLMVDVAIEGGGSSRFISDHDEMVKVFETELDRMLVPAARELQMRLELPEGVELENTWGYQHHIEGNTIHYYLPTLHNGDWETMFAEVSLAPGYDDLTLGQFYLDYLDLGSVPKSLGPFRIGVDSLAIEKVITDFRVREAEGFLRLSRGLIKIGNNALRISDLEQSLSQRTDPPQLRTDVIEQIKAELMRNLDYAEGLTTYLTSISSSLGGGKYEKELEILANYTETFTKSYDQHTGDTEPNNEQ